MVNILINLLTCADNGACFFNARDDTVKGCDTIFEDVKMGFNCVRWKNNKKFKTEYFFIFLNLKMLEIPRIN